MKKLNLGLLYWEIFTSYRQLIFFGTKEWTLAQYCLLLWSASAYLMVVRSDWANVIPPYFTVPSFLGTRNRISSHYCCYRHACHPWYHGTLCAISTTLPLPSHVTQLLKTKTNMCQNLLCVSPIFGTHKIEQPVGHNIKIRSRNFSRYAIKTNFSNLLQRFLMSLS